MKKKWASKIRYTRFIGQVVIKSRKQTALFHRTDNHEDGSKTQTYGIEISRSEYKRLKRELK